MGGMIMKKFSLEEYRKNPSLKVVTRDGKAVKILYTEARRDYSIIALVEREVGKDFLFSFLPDGTMYGNRESINDLFFSDEQSSKTKREGFVNIYNRDNRYISGVTIHQTEEDAKRFLFPNSGYITTIKIE